MLKQQNSKRLGGIKLTFEGLEALLDMKPGSIQTIQVNPMTQSITVIHNDTGRPTWEMYEGSQVPEWMPAFQYIARMPPRKEEISDGRE